MVNGLLAKERQWQRYVGSSPTTSAKLLQQ